MNKKRNCSVLWHRRQACVPIILWNFSSTSEPPILTRAGVRNCSVWMRNNCSLTSEPRILTHADVRNCSVTRNYSVTGLLELFITGFWLQQAAAAAALTMNNINNNIWDAIEAEAQELNRCEYTIVYFLFIFCKFVVLYYSCFFSLFLETNKQGGQSY